MSITLKELFKIAHLFNLKTVYFNFRYLPFKQAIKIPVFIARGTLLYKTKGRVIIRAKKVEPAMIRIGYMKAGLFDKKTHKAAWKVEGEVYFY
jgi:hypothetical protein